MEPGLLASMTSVLPTLAWGLPFLPYCREGQVERSSCPEARSEQESQAGRQTDVVIRTAQAERTRARLRSESVPCAFTDLQVLCAA